MTKKTSKMFRRPVTAKNIEAVQQQFERELRLHSVSQTVLNGWVQSVSGESARSEDVEYKFRYTPSDAEMGDSYVYTIDTFPARKQNQDKSISSDVSMNEENGYEQTSNLSPDIQNNYGPYTEVATSSANGQSIKSSSNKNICMATSKRILKTPGLDNGNKLKTDSDKCIDVSRKLSAKSLQRNVSLCTSEHQFDTRSRLHSAPTKTSRKASEMSRPSTVTSSQNRQATADKRKSVSYDPELDKATAFIHGGGHNFSSVNAHLTPIRNSAMKHLHMSYTETNLETNQSIIFLDLLRTSHQKHQLRESQVRTIERRLAAKRSNPLYSTSYYEHMHVPDPFRRKAKKTARSVAQKKLERKEKIKQLSDELHTGYVPTQLTMKIADQTEVDDIGRKCRYLRCKPPPE